MISSRSRYAGVATAKILSPWGDLRVTIVPGAARDWAFNYTYYQTKNGDRVDSLGRFFYGDDTKWWLIADANPQILDWTFIPPGTILRIPSG